MLDPVRSPGRDRAGCRRGVQDPLEHPGQLPVGPVAVGVHGQGQAVLPGAAQRVLQGLHGGEGQACAAAPRIGLQLPGGAHALGSVGKELAVADAQAVAPLARAQAQGDGFVQALSREVGPDPQVQVPVRRQGLPGPQGRPSFDPAHQALVVDSGEAEPVQGLEAVREGLGHLGAGGGRDPAGDQVDGQVPQDARGPAHPIPVDEPHRGVRSARADAGEAQSQGIGRGQMQVRAPKQDRMPGGGPVQVRPEGHAPIRPVRFQPAQAEDPAAGRGALGRLGDPPGHLAQGGHSRQLEPPAAQGPVVVVDVPVHQARDDPPALQVEGPGAGPAQGPDVRVPAHGQDPARADGHGGGAGAGGVLGVAASVDQQQAGHGRTRHSPARACWKSSMRS